MAFYGNNIGIIPLTDAAGITKVFNKQTHLGLDIGWSESKFINCPVLAWQDGTIVDKGFSSEVGNFVVLEHTYTTTKRWTGYIHLNRPISGAKGTKYNLGQQISDAQRGNTGKSNGPHLHLYLTQEVPITTTYTWNTMLMVAVDPQPYLYYDKRFNTDYIAPSWSKPLPKVIYPKPVARDELVEQVEIKSATRRLRNGPGLTFEAYPEYCAPGIYNVHSWAVKDGYDWALIDEIDGFKFYAAIMEGEDLPVTDYKKLYEEQKELYEGEKQANIDLKKQINEADRKLAIARAKLKSIRDITEGDL